MAKSKSNPADSGPAAQLAERLRAAVRDEQTAPPPGARDQFRLTGLTPSGQYDLPMEVVIQTGIEALGASGRVYTHGSAIVFEAVSFELASRKLADSNGDAKCFSVSGCGVVASGSIGGG